jgi:hypothetical protein
VKSKTRFKRLTLEEETRQQWRGHRLSPELTDLVGQLLRFSPEARLGMKGWD